MKNKNKQKTQTISLATANKITILIIDDIYPDLKNSLLFKVFLKNFLLNKSLKINNVYEVQLFSKNKSFQITENNLENKDELFMINEETDIDITYLDKELGNLNLNDTKPATDNVILKAILENKIKIKDEEVTLVALDTELTQIEQIIKFSLQEDYRKISKEDNISNCYLYKGILISGAGGTGKSQLIKYINKKYDQTINFFQIDIKEIIVYNVYNLEWEYRRRRIRIKCI